MLPFPGIPWWSMGDPTSLFTLNSSLPEAVHSSRLLRWGSSCAGRLQGLQTLHVIEIAVNQQSQETAAGLDSPTALADQQAAARLARVAR